MQAIKEVMLWGMTQFVALQGILARLFSKRTNGKCVLLANHYNNAAMYAKAHADTLVVFTKPELVAKYQALGCKEVYSYRRFWLFVELVALLQATHIVLDDYYPYLYLVASNKDVTNLWHANAIYKKIGFASPLYANRSRISINRYKRNFACYDRFLVYSEIEQAIVMSSLALSSDCVIVDASYYHSSLEKQQDKVKKKLVYAPTFRPYAYDYDAIASFLKTRFPDYEVVACLHPSMSKHAYNVYEVLRDAEILVSDYSALLFEALRFSQLRVYQMIDTQDLVTYEKMVGLNHIYTESYDIPTLQYKKV